MTNEIDILMDLDPTNLSAQNMNETDVRYAKWLLSKTILDGECLICHIDAINGYLKLRADEYAHRFICSIYNGPVIGKFVLHTCDNTRCINPKHLKIGTHKDNMDDMNAKGRRGKVGGGKPKLLTDVEIEDIRQLSRDGVSQRAIARHYKISQKTVLNYIHMETSNG